MSLDQWLLALHVTGAFALVGGAVLASVLSVLALRSTRPSEVAMFLGLSRVGVVAIQVGALLTIVLGLWLVHQLDYGYGQAWIVASLILWLASSAAGGIGGGREKETHALAERLAAEGDAPSGELAAKLRDPVTMALSWGASAGMIALLVLMIWKPGA
jgi:uncharacterized membrane protein